MNLDEISLLQILNSSNISKNRFLEILVADLKNQQQHTAPEHAQPDSQDSLSQLIFLIVVICLYSLGALCVLISRVNPSSRNSSHYYPIAENAHHLLNRMRDQTLLEQLRDTEYRKRVWSIYRKDSEGKDRRGSVFYFKNEDTILKSINKKLKTIEKEKDTAFEMR